MDSTVCWRHPQELRTPTQQLMFHHCQAELIHWVLLLCHPYVRCRSFNLLLQFHFNNYPPHQCYHRHPLILHHSFIILCIIIVIISTSTLSTISPPLERHYKFHPALLVKLFRTTHLSSSRSLQGSVPLIIHSPNQYLIPSLNIHFHTLWRKKKTQQLFSYLTLSTKIKNKSKFVQWIRPQYGNMAKLENLPSRRLTILVSLLIHIILSS